MKRVILSDIATDDFIYHGDRGSNPKLLNQRELGFHFGSLAEAQYHGKFIFKVKKPTMSNMLELNDPNNWASYEGLLEIYSKLDSSKPRDEIRDMWNGWRVDTNSREASQLIRSILNDAGVTCIKYTDTEDIPGEECYILLYQPQLIRCSFEESFPELYAAIRKVEEEKDIDLKLGSRFDGDYYIYCKNPKIDYDGNAYVSAVSLLGRHSSTDQAYKKLIKLC